MVRLSTRAFVLRLIFQIESFPRHEGKLRNREGGKRREGGRKILQINATDPEHCFQCQTLITIFHLAKMATISFCRHFSLFLVGLFLKNGAAIFYRFFFSASLLVDLQKIITIDRNPLSRSNLF